MKNRYILFLFIILSNFLAAQVYQLNLYSKGGIKSSYDINELYKITFNGVPSSSLKLTYPLDGTTEVPVTPILKWNLINSTKYSLQVSVSQDMSSPIIDRINLSNNFYQIITGLKGLTRYFWRVKSESDGSWTPISSFTTAMPYIFPPQTPKSFALINDKPNSLRLIIKIDPTVESYRAYLSQNGVTFYDSVSLFPGNTVINGLQADSLYYIRLAALNSGGISPVSEVLAGIPSVQKPNILLVHGFDRKSTGNTFNFIRFHASALRNSNQYFCSSTNEAITDSLITLREFVAADYILGDESTADETLSKSEQDLIKIFLINGGNLLISGSEIAWDLDYKGNTDDKYFMSNFLKAQFIADAPLDQNNTYYQVEGLSNSIFSNIPSISFDNGTQGTINVKYPDAVKPINNAKSCLKFTNVDTSQGIAGIFYNGLFPSGLVPGKIIFLSVPFETIYPEDKRNLVMQKITDFFFNSTGLSDKNSTATPKDFTLYQNYPNPFNPVTTIKYFLPRQSKIKLTIFDTLGKEIIKLVEEVKNPGTYEEKLEMNNFPSGIYFYKLTADNFYEIKKLVLIK